MGGNSSSPCWLAVWISLPPVWFSLSCLLISVLQRQMALRSPPRESSANVKTSRSEREKKINGFPTFIPPAGAMSEVVQELGLQLPLHSHL